jgi:hypothetical protein
VSGGYRDGGNTLWMTHLRLASVSRSHPLPPVLPREGLRVLLIRAYVDRVRAMEGFPPR